jgi:hypothetical protein
MGLYYDKFRKQIVQYDNALNLIDKDRFERHEPIGPCTCTKCRKDKTKQTNLVEYGFPDNIPKNLKIGKK